MYIVPAGLGNRSPGSAGGFGFVERVSWFSEFNFPGFNITSNTTKYRCFVHPDCAPWCNSTLSPLSPPTQPHLSALSALSGPHSHTSLPSPHSPAHTTALSTKARNRESYYLLVFKYLFTVSAYACVCLFQPEPERAVGQHFV